MDLFHGARIRLTAALEEDFELMQEWYEDAAYLRNVDTDIAFPLTQAAISKFAEESSNSFYFHLRKQTTNS